MAALLAALSVMAIMMTIAMPVWKQAAQREKEEELVFRGTQYVHAIGLFQRKMGPGVLPPSIDILVQQRFLRKKFKDPITNDEFQPLTQANAAAATAPPGSAPTSSSTPGATASQQTQQTGRGQTGPGASATAPSGGILGVVSKSKDKSIRLYNGRNHYNEWAFVFTAQTTAAGAGAPGAAPGGQRQGGPGQQSVPPGGGPFGRGNPNGPGGRGNGPGGRGFQPGIPKPPPQPPRRPGS